MADETTMPAPSKVEKLKERMRNKQGLPPTKAAAPMTSTVSTAPPPPATVKHVCGHEAPFQEIAKDKFRNERYQKELKRTCPACRQANQETIRKAQEENQAKKKPLSFGHYSDPGTGVGYSFIFHHLAVAQWEWSLVKMRSSQEVGKGTCKSLRMGIAAMNEILSKVEQPEATLACTSAPFPPEAGDPAPEPEGRGA
jgi:hypothetical protein